MRLRNFARAAQRPTTLVAAMAALVFAAGATAGKGDSIPDAPYVQIVERGTDAQASALAPLSVIGAESAMQTVPGLYTIRFADAPVASYRGQVAGLSRIPTIASRGGRPDMRSVQARQYADYLQSKQSQFVATLSQQSGSAVKVIESYQFALNGVTVKLDANQLDHVRRQSGVAGVEPVSLLKLDTDVGPTFIGAPAIWNGTTTGGAPATQGEGIVIGVIDSGVNWESPSFADVVAVVDGGDGFDHVNPLGAGNYLGVCATEPVDADIGPNCNDKLIGAYAKSFDFVQQVNAECADLGNPGNELGLTQEDCDDIGVPLVDYDNALDENGHGSHTASTSGGNQTAVSYQGNNLTVSGVAKHANLIAYDVCHTNINGQGSCFNFATLAAIEQVVEDGIVDVINYSIGGGTSPWTQANSLAFLAAVDAGVFVSASAGNSGPAASTLGHVEPWVATVAASTHTRGAFSIRYTANGTTVPTTPAVANQQVFLGSVGGPHDDLLVDVPVIISPDIDTAANPPTFLGDGCAPYPAGTFTGAVAVIRRGGCTFVDKVTNAEAAGAISVIIANNQAGEIAPGGANDVPFAVFGANQASADALRDYVNVSNLGVATITIPLGGIADAVAGDVMADFSSRGPSAFDALKPDITGPGVNILAAYVGADPSTPSGASDPAGYEVISGTSMSSPHNAGSAALVRAVHPDWSVAEVKSAMMLSSKNSGITKEDGVTTADPHDRGAGRIDLNVAAESGLVMDETPLKMFQADPDAGGDPTTLNIPSLQSSNCIGTCTFTRRVRSVAAMPLTYQASFTNASGVTATVTPSLFTISPGQSQTLEIEIDSSASDSEEWHFGELSLTPALDPAGNHSETTTPGAPIPMPDGGYVGGFGGASQACVDVDTTGDFAAGLKVQSAQITVAASHTWIGDLVYKLRSPDSTVLGVLSRPGTAETSDTGPDGSAESSNILDTFPITFRDGAAATAESMGVVPPLTSAEVVCRDGGSPCEYSPNPGSIAQPPSNFAGFIGQNASGIWSFCAGDSEGFDTGSLTAVTLELTLGDVVAPTLHMPVAVYAIDPAPAIELNPTSLNANGQVGGPVVSQPLTIGNVGFVDLTWDSTTATNIPGLPLYSQLLTLADNPGSGFRSGTYSGNANNGVYLSDSFTLNSPQDIGSFFVDGFVFAATPDLAYQDVTLFVFPNNAALTPNVPDGDPQTAPGSALYTYTGTIGDPGLSVDLGPFGGSIELDLVAAGETLSLPAGKYWLVVAPIVGTFAGATNNDEWFQMGTGPTLNLDDVAMIRDAGNLLGAGPLAWQPLAPLLAPPNNARFNGMSLEVKAGSTACGAPWLSTAPTSGTVAAQDSQAITVNFDPTGLVAGTYNAVVCVSSNDPATPIAGAPVTFVVAGASTDPSATGLATPAAAGATETTLLTVEVTAGTNPTSTGITVQADLTSIGGSATQAFLDNGLGGDAVASDGTFSYTATVGVGSTVGATSFLASVVDAQARTASANIAFEVLATTDPTGVGLATPASVALGGTSLLTVDTTGGTNPTSTGLSVAVDLSSIGGSAAQSFVDDGTGGDATAGDGTFTFTANVPLSAMPGQKSLTATISDAQARTGSTAIDLTVTSPSAPSGVGLATPAAVFNGGSSLLTVAVTSGDPASTGLEVMVNLAAVGGSATQQMFDDGSNGDVTAADGTFSFNLAAASGAPGNYDLSATISDDQARASTAIIDLEILAPLEDPIFADGFEGS